MILSEWTWLASSYKWVIHGRDGTPITNQDINMMVQSLANSRAEAVLTAAHNFLVRRMN
jgi:hypothetical protein